MCQLEKCNQNFTRINKLESLAFQELVNHSCLGEGECLHPFEPNSDQKLKKKSSFPILSEEIFENRGHYTLNFLIHTEIIQSSHKCLQLRCTVNTFENIDTKFHNDQRKNQGGGTYFYLTV